MNFECSVYFSSGEGAAGRTAIIYAVSFLEAHIKAISRARELYPWREVQSITIRKLR